MNSTMGDRGETPPSGVWPWYNMYQHAYQPTHGYSPYGHQGYYPYYQHGHHPPMHFHGQQQSLGLPHGMKEFVPGGQLMPFNKQNGGMEGNNPDQQNMAPANNNGGKNDDQQSQNNNNNNKKDDKKEKKKNNNDDKSCADSSSVGGDNMPPLPPGPPPPMMRFPTPPPPGTSPNNRFYQPNSMGPVKFSFGAKQVRPGAGGFGGLNMNQSNENTGNNNDNSPGAGGNKNNGSNNNSNNNNNNNNNNGNNLFLGGGGKKKRKRNKGNKMNAGGGGMMNNNQSLNPPLPPHILLKVPPPLPPGPPPNNDQPPLPPSSPDNSSALSVNARLSATQEDIGGGMDKNNHQIRMNFNNHHHQINNSNNNNNGNMNRKNNFSARSSMNSMISLEECPQSLKSYMERCYSKCSTPMDHDRVDIILKGKIMRASSDDTLWTKDWDNEPLPLLANELENVVLKTSSPQPQHDLSPPRKQGKGLSAAMESRLGGRRSFSHKSRSPVRNNKSSPKRRRDRSESSTSSEENYKPLKSSKSKMAKFNKSRNSNSSSSNSKNKAKKQMKSHFYSETGFVEETNPEILEKRAARFSNNNNKSSAEHDVSNSNSSFQEYQSPLVSMRRKKSLKLNFDSCNNSFQDFNSGEFELSDCHVVGICQDIEKPYLRLTAAPEPSAVRPPEVLQVSLNRVKERWIQNQDYYYACEQLKSIRQDLTVQGIRDSLTVKVYETHARIALEKGDHAEFNQCQSQLRMLYCDVTSKNRLEFTAYRILYYIFTKDFMDLSNVIATLTEEDKKDECVGHALKVQSAWWLSNYHRLFKLYKCAPRMSSYLIDWFLPRERKLALKAIVKSYRPNLAIDFVSQELAFEKEDECTEFLAQFGVVYADPERTKIDCKASVALVCSSA